MLLEIQSLLVQILLEVDCNVYEVASFRQAMHCSKLSYLLITVGRKNKLLIKQGNSPPDPVEGKICHGSMRDWWKPDISWANDKQRDSTTYTGIQGLTGPVECTRDISNEWAQTIYLWKNIEVQLTGKYIPLIFIRLQSSTLLDKGAAC